MSNENYTAEESRNGVIFLIMFILFLITFGMYLNQKIRRSQEYELYSIERMAIKKAIKKKGEEKAFLLKDYGKLKTHFTKMNGWVSDCWSCSKLKKQDTLLTIFILELGQRN